MCDDDQAVRAAVRLILDGRHEVLESGNSDQALALIESQPVDLVLLDILINGIDGITLLGQLRTRRPQIPVIMSLG